jgi:inositol-1,4,5-trisphosphate 5-phosphatase
MQGLKGAVSIRMTLYGVSLCFVNSHLSAHDHLLKK